MRYTRSRIGAVYDWLACHMAAHFELHAAGSYRRGLPDCKDLDVVVVGEEDLRDLLPHSFKIIQGGKKIVRGFIDAVPVDLYRCSREEAPYMLLFLTGSKEHNIWLRQEAMERGWRLSQTALVERLTGDPVGDARCEDDIFALLDMDYVEPAERVA